MVTAMVYAANPPFGQEEVTAVLAVLASGQLWRGNGPGWGSLHDRTVGAVTDRLEDAVAQWLGLPYVHAVNSGTSANEAAMASLGLEPGDEVICPAASPTFVPFAILAAGCIPVFADVDPETLLLDPAKIERLVSSRTRALVVVHLWGLPAPMSDIMSVAERSGLKVVEDCAQAFGTFINGQLVGTFGDASCYSLQQSKHITCGEGGIFSTKNSDAYMRAVLYSNAGIPNFRFGVSAPKKEHHSLGRGHLQFGHNHRISELQAAVALAQFSRIDQLNRRRAELVKIIDMELNRRKSTSLRTTRIIPDCTISYWRYPVLVPPGRGTFLEIPYLEPVFREINSQRLTPFGAPIPGYINYDPGSCPNAEMGASQIRAISVHHSLTDQEFLETMERSLSDLW